LSRFLGRRDESAPLADDLTVRKATERAEMMSTGELTTWVESISSTVAVGIGSYSAHRDDDTQLLEARRQIEVLHALLTVLISRP
jgi:hypothetical protein